MKDIYIEWREICKCIERICDCVEDADFDGIKGMFIDAKAVTDVRPVVRGQWVKDSDGIYICSECGEVALQRVFIKLPKKIVDLQMVQSAFCPNCGAWMEGEP